MTHKVDITLFNGSARFEPGNVIKGEVSLRLLTSIKVNELKLDCRGKAVVSWSVGFGEDARSYYDYETYIDQEQVLYEKEKTDGKFLKGTHSFPFEFLLPDDIPCSFEGPGCYIRYKLRAILKQDKQRFSETIQKLTFYVQNNRIVDLNEVPFGNHPVTQSATKEHGRMCCGSGPISASFSINRTCFVPGETIICKVHLDNHTSINLDCIEVKLMRRVIRKVRFSPTKVVESRADVKLEKLRNANSNINSAMTVDWNYCRLLIRQGTCPMVNDCRILETEYFVRMDTKPFGLKIPIDIVIGTIPLRGLRSGICSSAASTTAYDVTLPDSTCPYAESTEPPYANDPLGADGGAGSLVEYKMEPDMEQLLTTRF